MTHKSLTEPISLERLYWECSAHKSPEERAEWLARNCPADPVLRAKLELMLASEEDAERFGQHLFPMVDLNENRADLHSVTIGPYKLCEKIGEGGMGVVYVAKQNQPLKRRVAIKIIKPGMDSRQIIARFQAELESLALMDHPHIARVLDAGTTGSGLPYFVMELVPGESITAIADQLRLTLDERLRLFQDVCRAVQHAHMKGIIHRDIKPSNVLVTLHDGKPVVKVIDFGVAKAMGQQLNEHSVYTGLGQMVGTPMYMSPEQAELSGLDVDTRSDVYSLGVLLYELLTGVTPFDQDSFRKAGLDVKLRIIREQEPLKPSSRLSTIKNELRTTVADSRRIDAKQLSHRLRGELDWIAMKALEKDRQQRYSSPMEFAEDIQRLLDGQPVGACPPSAIYRLRKYAQRHRLWLTAATLILLAMLAGTGFSVWYAFEAQKARDNARMSNDLANQRLALLQKQQKELASEQGTSERNFTLAKQAVAKLMEEIAQEQVIAHPELATFRTKLLMTADDFCSKLLDEDPISVDLLLARGTVRIRLNQMEAGLGDYLLAAKSHPDDARVHSVLADFYQNATNQSYRDRALSLRHAQRAVELEPNQPEHWFTLAWVQWASYGRKQEASEAMHRSAMLANDEPTREYRLAIATELAGNDPLAIESYSRLLARELEPAIRAGVFLRRGMCRLRAGRYEAAITDFTESIRADAFNALAYEHRAYCYFSLQSYQQTIDDWNRAIKLAPRLGEDAIPDWISQVGSQGSVKLIPGEREGALLSLRHVLECYVTLEDWHGAARLIAGRSGKFSGDRAMLNADLRRRIIESGNEDAIVASDQLIERVVSNLKQERNSVATVNYFQSIGEYQRAIDSCDEMIEAAGDEVTVEMYLFRAEIYRDKLQDFREAAADYERAYERHRVRPRAGVRSYPLGADIKLLSELAVLQLHSGNMEGYDSTCRSMLELCDQNQLPGFLAAEVLWSCLLGGSDGMNYHELETRIERYHANQGSKEVSGMYHLLTAAVMLRSGQYEEARRHLLQEFTAQPSSGWEQKRGNVKSYTSYLLSIAESHLGNTADAEKYFQEAGKSPGLSWDEKMRRQLLKAEAERAMMNPE